MSENKTTDEEIEVVETEDETLPDLVDANGADTKIADTGGDDDDDDDEGDDRIGDDREQSDEEIEASARSKRMRRRQKQKAAKDRTLQQVELLARQNEMLAKRLASLEGTTLAQSENEIDRRMAEAEADLRRANNIIAKAVEAGNGGDVAAAMEVRDEVRRKLDGYEVLKARVAKTRETPAEGEQPQPQVDPRVQNYGRQWMSANSWYDPAGRDEDSAIVNAIDRVLVSEGYDPSSVDYWDELTDRVKSRLGGSAPKDKAADPPARRRGPPVAMNREHAPAATRNQVIVTPERKRAMMELGVWDDPAKRQRYLKAYRDYDLNSSAR
jgi:hypothetical protein